MYSELFSKPKMTEKLLNKPPFRYLHDVFTATLEKTGFANGLFEGEELNSKGKIYEDKAGKTQFLVKLITLTEMMVGEKIDIKPSTVLAGKEADKTNVWLQQMFRAATSGEDSAPYVQQLIGGGEEDGGQDEDLAAQQAAEEQAKAQEEQRQREEKKRRHEEKKRRQQQKEEEER